MSTNLTAADRALPRLHGYWRSSAAWRVRIALNLKGVEWSATPVHLVRGGGEQRQPAFLRLNPQGLVPALEIDGLVLTQSLAIIEYLEETRPAPALLPPDPAGRARVRSLAQLVASDIHPLNNLRVLQQLEGRFGLDAAQRRDWYCHWVEEGLRALEKRIAAAPETGRFCHGDAPGLADCCLVPQLYNARRYGCSLEGLPELLRIEAACAVLPAFTAAAADAQADAVAGA
ncbi:maleylacetoacetate isomerase [Wenzhouxiangella sp. XN24]|uniref:maleylacetoacetate isomerase n=1 Tax=Wenzhouxiangella sp. XN24 TaxID=2713569 RepID=UPI0013EC1B07|nr:maleylacetoacetate isomerase [Wenzhouxiangella sp. XN24]NGX14878.1 maleylacetoacetate isomerase [Wenzhouxiangella sp. XN24]